MRGPPQRGAAGQAFWKYVPRTCGTSWKVLWAARGFCEPVHDAAQIRLADLCIYALHTE